MSEQAIGVRPWSIEGFRAFWGAPDPSFVPRVHDVCAPGIVGHWPRPIGLVRGTAPYVDVIAAILAVCPDFRLAAPDHAAAGDVHFVRWEASGTAPDGHRFAFDGIDRLKVTPDGRVSENYVCSDGPLFAWVAAQLARQGWRPG